MKSRHKSELHMYGTLPRTDFLDYYEGMKERKLSVNNMLDEFHQLIVKNDEIAIYETNGLKTTDLKFIIVRAFLGQKSFEKNQTQKLVRTLLGDNLGEGDIKDEMTLRNLIFNVPDEISDEIQEQFKECFAKILSISNCQKLDATQF